MKLPPQPPAERREHGAGSRQRALGDYVIERELGRGGMGVVWLATQRSLGRKVALKVLPNFASLDADAVVRFRREAEAMGRLAHQGIAPVYGVGEAEGVHYFAMEFIDGPTLGAVIDILGMRQVEKLRQSLVEEAQIADRYPTLREPAATGAGNRYVRSCARICADVANALAAAHREKVVHRDLKPGNILIHPAGRPVLVDFGLARDELAQGLTRTGDQLGTPAYMAPEQARGSRRLDARVDVYGLGAVLYELLTLRPPFEGASSAEIVQAILTDEPVALRRRNPNVPVDLAAIVHRCLAKDPEQRYPAIEALELDLRNFLTGRTVTAQLPGHGARLLATLQRHRRSLHIGVLAAASATLVAVLAGLADDRGDQRHGDALLEQATGSLVEQLDVDRARALYEQASALTKDEPRVQAARVRDFRDAFTRHYGDKPRGPAALRAFAAILSARDRKQVEDLLARLDGRGTLQFAARAVKERTGKLELRRVTEHGLGDWHEVQAGQLLPTGEYLLRATDQAGVVAVNWTRIEADAETTIAPRYLDPASLPEDFAAIVDPDTQQMLLASRYEVTRDQWRQWLGSLPAALVEEMTPLGWDGGASNPDAAVRGLSFHQARAYAAAQKAHLPTAREHWLAGSAGLRGLTWPWGGVAEPLRIAADPFQLEDAESVRSRPEGQSPLGVFHVLGNVAEVHTAGVDGALQLGGGSFFDDPTTLQLLGDRGTVPTVPLTGIRDGQPGAGLRLYRFVAPPDAAAPALDQARREELRASAPACLFSDWLLRGDGTLRCAVEWHGRYEGGDRTLQLPFDTPGFLQRQGHVRALDGHGRELPGKVETAPGAERSRLSTELGDMRAGQGYHFSLTAELEPGLGLQPHRDAYVLRLPMRRDPRIAQVYTLQLPAGCRVDDATPPPTHRSGDGSWLAWEQTTGQIETAVVRFRSDGALTAVPVVRKQTDKMVRSFLGAWKVRNPDLGDWLDNDFVYQPGAVDRRQMSREQPREQLLLAELVDSVRIGAIETVDLRLDWEMTDRDGSSFRLPRWPFMMQWRHGKSEPKLLRLQPNTTVDRGRHDRDAGYLHPGLKVRLLPVADSVLCRTQEEVCDLQVRLLHTGSTAGEGALSAQVLGYLAEVGEPPAAIRFRLTNGASVLRPGERIAAVASDGGTTEDWLFVDSKSVSRERWCFIKHGRRHLLLRFAASGETAALAQAAFAAPSASSWFAAVRQALRVD